MSHVSAFSNTSLLSVFFEECEAAFAFLQKDHRFGCISGLARHDKVRKVITPYTGQDVETPFYASVRYESKNTVLELTYGHEDFSIEGFLHFNTVYRLPLQDVLETAQKQDFSIHPKSRIHDPKTLNTTITDFARSVKNHKRYFLKYDQKFLEKAIEMRAQKIETQLRTEFEENLHLTLTHATIAFAEEDFRSVVVLLTHYKDYLPPADQKKLELARKALMSV